MTPERQAAIRAALEQDDPDLYYAMGGNRSLAATKHDYDVKWELLLALEDAQERIALLETVLEGMCSVFYRAAWRTDEREAMEKARAALEHKA